MKVTPRARSRDDRAGDPLDGLVNLFDLGIVLSVAFLLAALSSLDLTEAITGEKTAAQTENTRPAATRPHGSAPARSRISQRSPSRSYNSQRFGKRETSFQRPSTTARLPSCSQ